MYSFVYFECVWINFCFLFLCFWNVSEGILWHNNLCKYTLYYNMYIEMGMFGSLVKRKDLMEHFLHLLLHKPVIDQSPWDIYSNQEKEWAMKVGVSWTITSPLFLPAGMCVTSAESSSSQGAILEVFVINSDRRLGHLVARLGNI